MAVTHGSAARTAICNAAVDLLDVGAGANGTLVFQTAGGSAVATLNLTAKGTGAFGAASGPTATANAIANDTNAAGGTVAKFELRNCDGTAVILGAVGTSGSDINLSSLTIGAGDTVSISSLTYTAAP